MDGSHFCAVDVDDVTNKKNRWMPGTKHTRRQLWNVPAEPPEGKTEHKHLHLTDSNLRDDIGDCTSIKMGIEQNIKSKT